MTRVDGSPLERQMAVTILGQLARCQGDADLAWAMVRELLPRGPASEPGDALFPYAIETLELAVKLALDASDLDAAREWLQTHDSWLDWSGAVRGRADSQLLWAQIHLAGGDLDRSEPCAMTALDLANDPRQPLSLLAIHRFLGHLSLHAKRNEDAGKHLAEALSMAEACEAPYEQARTLIELAELYLSTGRQNEVQQLLDDARAIARDLAAIPIIEAAENLEEQVESATNGVALTAREIDVLRLVAQGMTDAEAASQLYISPRTVGQHLRSIYNKLGVSSRTVATRRAVEERLI